MTNELTKPTTDKVVSPTLDIMRGQQICHEAGIIEMDGKRYMLQVVPMTADPDAIEQQMNEVKELK